MSKGAEIVDLDEQRVSAQNQIKLGEIHSQLAKSDKGVVLGILSNLILIIGHDPVIASVCAFDEFGCNYVFTKAPPMPFDDVLPPPGPYPRAWDKADVAFIQNYIQRAWCQQAKKSDVEQAMVAVASMRRFHPVRDWLADLRWDNVKRLDDWLHKTFGVPQTAYTDELSRCVLIAAVRRARRPGVKFDNMLILEGPQGAGKSSALRILFGEQWFTDSLPAALGSKDAAIGLQGVWCVEFGEIEQIIRAELETIKAFLSRASDRLRVPYEAQPTKMPRQCVLIGTTNETDYLRDPSGNRRFWPIWCEKVDLEWLTENREQLWAEAAHRESLGDEHWFIDSQVIEQASKEQREREQGDIWEEKIMKYAISQPFDVKIPDIMSDALFIPIKDHSRGQQMRVASVLRRHGWTRHVGKDGETSVKVWRRPRGGSQEVVVSDEVVEDGW